MPLYNIQFGCDLSQTSFVYDNIKLSANNTKRFFDIAAGQSLLQSRTTNELFTVWLLLRQRSTTINFRADTSRAGKPDEGEHPGAIANFGSLPYDGHMTDIRQTFDRHSTDI